MGINAHKIGTCTTLTKLLRVFAYASGAKTEASLVSFYDQRYVRDSQKWAICTVFLFSLPVCANTTLRSKAQGKPVTLPLRLF